MNHLDCCKLITRHLYNQGYDAVCWEVSISLFRFDVLAVSSKMSRGVHVVEVKTSVEDLRAGLKRMQLSSYMLSEVRPNYLSIAIPEDLLPYVADLKISSRVGIYSLSQIKGRDQEIYIKQLRKPMYTAHHDQSEALSAIARAATQKLMVDDASKVPASGIVSVSDNHKAD